MMVKFVSYNGVAYRVLHTGEGGMWLISYEEPTNHFFYIGDGLERIQTPEGFLEQSSKKKLTAAQQSRLALIHPLLDAQPRSITDRSYRLALAKEIAREQGTTYRGAVYQSGTFEAPHQRNLSAAAETGRGLPLLPGTALALPADAYLRSSDGENCQ